MVRRKPIVEQHVPGEVAVDELARGADRREQRREPREVLDMAEPARRQVAPGDRVADRPPVAAASDEVGTRNAGQGCVEALADRDDLRPAPLLVSAGDRLPGAPPVDDQRAALESRLEEDPALAKRLGSYREIGRSLREGEEELSAGFYTRARARFEEAARGRERRWFRPFSWETVGLAAATVLAAALFLPGLLTDRIATMRPSDEMPVPRIMA